MLQYAESQIFLQFRLCKKCIFAFFFFLKRSGFKKIKNTIEGKYSALYSNKRDSKFYSANQNINAGSGLSVTSNTTGFTFCFANKLLEENIYILSTQIFHLLQGLPLLAFVDYCSSLAHQFEHAMIEGLTYTQKKKKLKIQNKKQIERY